MEYPLDKIEEYAQKLQEILSIFNSESHVIGFDFDVKKYNESFSGLMANGRKMLPKIN